jgi:tryptophanyl-tRNA synthetase
MDKKRILTGDRPTGSLHLGHYVGSLANRVRLQHEYDTYILIADVQALTTHFNDPSHLKQNIWQVALDYMAAGLEPEACTVCIQSRIPQLHELTTYFGLFTSVNVLRHNPTIKSEARQHGFDDMPFGFLGYPVSQSADICIFKAHVVPVGEDQIPHIELTRKIARRFNSLYREVFVEPEALIGKVSRLAGLDGKTKMSKSLNNCIYLSDLPDTVKKKINTAVTDPERLRKDDPGHPQVCTVFAYHQVFNGENLPEIEAACRQGQIGCVQCKKDLADKINALLEPMHERRSRYLNDPKLIRDIVAAGTEKAVRIAETTMEEVRDAMQMQYFKD